MPTAKGFSEGLERSFLTTLVPDTIEKDTDEAFDGVKRRTPRRTGQTAAAWRKRTGKDLGVVQNDEPHINVLERGRGRRQQGHFMVARTLKDLGSD